MGERRQEEEQQQFATEGTQVGEMSGREQEKHYGGMRQCKHSSSLKLR